MKKVAIVGGHGQIALLLTEQLSQHGIAVSCLSRNPDHAADIEAAGGTYVQHDLEVDSIASLAGKLAGHDAVIFAAGAGPTNDAARKFAVDLGGSVISASAALSAGVNRFVQISFIGAELPTPEGTPEVFAAYWEAKREADDSLRLTPLDWSIIKPGALLNEPGTGNGAIAATFDRGVRTIREDVATTIRLVLDDPRSYRRDISVAEGEAPLADELDRFLK